MLDPGRKRLLFGGFLLLACLIVTAAEIFFFVRGLDFLGGLLSARPGEGEPEAIAVETVVEAAGPGASEVRILQQQQAGVDERLDAFLVSYREDGERSLQLVVIRESGQDYLVAETIAGPVGQAGGLEARVILLPDRPDTHVAVYGTLPVSQTAQIVVGWPIGYDIEAMLSEGAYLLFRSWSPVDGSPLPSAVTAYDADGRVIERVTLTPPQVEEP